MKLKWLVALAVILAFVWASGAMAGPTKPAGGDPDIWERAKPNYPSGAIKTPVMLCGSRVAINMVVFKASVTQQDAKDISTSEKSRRLAVAERGSIRR
jgi:hypothetical protein